MSGENQEPEGPDLAIGIAASAIPDGGMVTGHVGDEPVLLARRGATLFAVGASCTHYGAPLGDGLMVGETVRCPWHHACFDLRTGRALRAPALDPLPCWRVDEAAGVVRVGERLEPGARAVPPSGPDVPASVVIIGGGPAGYAAALTLRDEGYAGRVTILSADESLPADRPNLSKSYLAGEAPEEWTLLKPADFYKGQAIDVHLGVRVAAIDVARGSVELTDGRRHAYGALLLATGARPNPLPVPGADMEHVHYLRTLADSRAIVADATAGRRAVVIGASFIGLEVAASLRARDVEVAVVGRDEVPMAKILGPEAGAFIRRLHESHGVTFHLGAVPAGIDADGVTLEDGTRLDADFVIVGVGVAPALELAEQAGLAVDRGIVVDDHLRTSAPNVFAAGDVARWPDPLGGERIRIEHFAVAERQGQVAARNILGRREAYDAVPFFWTEQYDLALGYVGHAEEWDEAVIDGSLEQRDCMITYRRGGRTLAVAVVNRDLDGIRAELEFEREIACGHAPHGAPEPEREGR